MVQYLPIIITALLGLLGLISKTKKDDKPGYFNKLTPFGIIVLLLLLASFIVAIWLQNNKDMENENQKREARNKAVVDSLKERHKFEIDSIGREATIDTLKNQKNLIIQQKIDDSARFNITLLNLNSQKNLILRQKFDDSIRFNVTLSNFGEQLLRQNQTLLNIQKVIHPINDVKFSFNIEIAEGESLKYKKYLDRVKSGIDSLSDILHSSTPNVNGISIAGWTNNIANRFTISRSSSLYPNSSGNEEEIYSLPQLTPTVYIYKNPIDINQTFFYFQTFKIGEGVNINELAKRKNPDLERIYYHEDGKENRLVYNRWENTIAISSGPLQTHSDFSEPSGTITSILDLVKARVFIQFPNIDSSVSVIPRSLSLGVGELSINFDPDKVKIYKHNNQVYFEYDLDTYIKAVLAKWQEE